MRFIDQHAVHRCGGRRWGVESICAQLAELGAPIAPSTYYAQRGAKPTAAQVRNAQLAPEVAKVHGENYGVYGARKVWAQPNREGIVVARCTVERLMRAQGLAGARRGRRVRTTLPGGQARAGDLVGRRFNPPAPDQLWVADFTYVPNWSGMVYVAFVVDAYSRRIVGWRAATSMRTELVLDALEHAVWTRAQQGRSDLDGLIMHTDAGSQYTSIAYTERLATAGAAPSVGTVGDAYDNALAEPTIGLFKTELSNREGLGGLWSRSRSPLSSTSTGSTTAGSIAPPGTSLPRSWRQPTTVNEHPNRNPRAQADNSPDTPGRFTGQYN